MTIVTQVYNESEMKKGRFILMKVTAPKATTEDKSEYQSEYDDEFSDWDSILIDDDEDLVFE